MVLRSYLLTTGRHMLTNTNVPTIKAKLHTPERVNARIQHKEKTNQIGLLYLYFILGSFRGQQPQVAMPRYDSLAGRFFLSDCLLGRCYAAD